MATQSETRQHRINRFIGKKLFEHTPTANEHTFIGYKTNEADETTHIIIELYGVEATIDVDFIYNYLTEWQCCVFDNDDIFEIKLKRLEDCQELAAVAYLSIVYNVQSKKARKECK